MAITLYGHQESQFAYKVRLALAFLKVPYEVGAVDMMKGEHRSERFLKMNPSGKIPILTDDDFVLWESNAILFYLAHRVTPNALLPENVRQRAVMHQWIQYEAGVLGGVVRQARFHSRFAPPHVKSEALIKDGQEKSAAAFAILDARLSGHDFLAGPFSAADIAVYPHFVVAPEGGIDLSPYGHLAGWAKRIEALPGFVALRG